MHMQAHCFPVSCDIFASRAVIRPERAEQPVSQSQVYSKASREQEKTTSKQMLNRKSTMEWNRCFYKYNYFMAEQM